MPNHASFLDTLLAFAHIPCDFRDIIKEEVFSIPLLGLVLRRSGQIKPSGGGVSCLIQSLSS